MSQTASSPATFTSLVPGATVGVIGGGQLGLYFALKARQLGYSVWVLDPDVNAPAMQIASVPLVAEYDDDAALRKLGEACDGVTIEFENVPASSLDLLQGITQLAPASSSVRIAQDRLLEKQKAEACGLMPVPHIAVVNMEDAKKAGEKVGFPAILKTARLGYDGKGQVQCETADEVVSAFISFGSVACVLEQRISLAAELSVVLARGFDGEMAVFPVAQNVHVDGILHTSTVPARQSDDVLQTAGKQACSLAQSIEYTGVLAVEFFVAEDNSLYFNEMAPRPHNSGHYTLDATQCSQFEQQLRALCALPMGSTELLSPVCMVNLLGDLWQPQIPAFSDVFAKAGCHLHLYGKTEARQGRKMGHINCLSKCEDSALNTALKQFSLLN